MIWPAQWAHLAKMGFCEREQHLLWIQMSCTMRLALMEGTRLSEGHLEHEMKAWAPLAICTALNKRA